MPPLKNEIGSGYGRLTVLDQEPERDARGETIWVVQCNCGSKPFSVRGSSLRSGHTQSCGCYKKEINTKHGQSYTANYKIWIAMKHRCYNKDNKDYKFYGGREIKVCDEWLNSLEKFNEDIGPRPSNKHSIERKDVNGDYCPENCRWATFQEQVNNRRSNVKLFYNGKNLTLAEWAREINLPRSTIATRYHRGWDIESILTTPKIKRAANAAR